MQSEPASSPATSVFDQITAEGKHVVVLGGGDTGADCIGTAHRQGALSVTNLAIGKQPSARRAPSTSRGRCIRPSSRCRAPTRRAASAQYLASTVEFLANEVGRGARHPRRRDRVPRRPSRAEGGHRARDPRRPRAAGARASPAPRRATLDEQLQLPVRPTAATSPATATTRPVAARRVRRRRRRSRAVAHRLGDRRGPRCGIRRRPVP